MESPRPLLGRLWTGLTPRLKAATLGVLGLMLAAGLAEFLQLAALRDLLQAVTAPAPDVGMPLLALAAAASLAALIRLAAFAMQDRLLIAIAARMSLDIYARALAQPYAEHLRRRTAELYTGLENSQRLLNSTLGPLLQGLVNGVVAAGLLTFLVCLAPLAVLPLAGLALMGYLLAGRLTGRGLRAGSHSLQDLAARRIQLVQETERGFRDIVLDQAGARQMARFTEVETAWRQRQVRDRFAAIAPRYAVELAVVLVLAGVGWWTLGRSGGAANWLPEAGVLALGILRLLPLTSGSYNGWSQFQSNRAFLAQALDLVDRPVPPAAPAEPVAFGRDIVFEHVSLDYPDRPGVLTGVNLTLRKGERIGIVGPSGAGKSSLLDVLLGLIEPTGGRILVDGLALNSEARRQGWKARLACVAQATWLPDANLEEVVTGSETADPARLADALRDAGLDDVVARLPQGLATRTGEAGLLLSGGQRQRLAIARALYRQADVLVLDEATGQLDAAAEVAVLDGLDRLDASITVVIVTHRRTALRGCSRVLTLDHGVLTEDG